ncbi:MAG: hypothetical protein K2W95_12920 [Candidatus Obscuribacterales bacterium]|nr:hypothetical protein [Candidatus Obscuribacterales bacterium]
MDDDAVQNVGYAREDFKADVCEVGKILAGKDSGLTEAVFRDLYEGVMSFVAPDRCGPRSGDQVVERAG